MAAAERNLAALAPFTAGAEASVLPPFDEAFDADPGAGDEANCIGTAGRVSMGVDSARVSGPNDAFREVRAAKTAGAVQDPFKSVVVPRQTVNYLFQRKFLGRRVSLRRGVLASKVPAAHQHTPYSLG